MESFIMRQCKNYKNDSGNNSMLQQLTLISWNTGPDRLLITPKVLYLLQRFLDKWFKRSYFTISHPIFNPHLPLRLQKDKLAPTMIIRWNEYVLRQAIVQPNLIHFKDWIDNYAEACEDLSTSQKPTIQENTSSRRSNRFFQQQSNKRCPLCGYSHNLGKCNQFLYKDINERQQTLKQLKICPNCLTEHPKRQWNSHYRCRIENCNEFPHSTIHRNNFISSQSFSPTQQQQRNQQQQHQQQTNNQVQNHSANNYHNNRFICFDL